MGREESQREEREEVEGLRQGKATGSYVRVSDACGLVMGVEVWEQRKASADFPGICLLTGTVDVSSPGDSNGKEEFPALGYP